MNTPEEIAKNAIQDAEKRNEQLNLSVALFNIASETNQSFSEVCDAALFFADLKLDTIETLKRTKDACLLAQISGRQLNKCVENLTSVVESFCKNSTTSAKIVNKLAAVDNRFEISSTELAEAISRCGNEAKNAGVSFDVLLDLIVDLQRKTKKGGKIVGEALKLIFNSKQTMDALQFCYWAQGFFEIAKPEKISTLQLQEIKNHLKLVQCSIEPKPKTPQEVYNEAIKNSKPSFYC